MQSMREWIRNNDEKTHNDDIAISSDNKKFFFDKKIYET